MKHTKPFYLFVEVWFNRPPLIWCSAAHCGWNNISSTSLKSEVSQRPGGVTCTGSSCLRQTDQRNAGWCGHSTTSCGGSTLDIGWSWGHTDQNLLCLTQCSVSWHMENGWKWENPLSKMCLLKGLIWYILLKYIGNTLKTLMNKKNNILMKTRAIYLYKFNLLTPLLPKNTFAAIPAILMMSSVGHIPVCYIPKMKKKIVRPTLKNHFSW